MSLNITSEQYKASRQAVQSRYVKIDLLNYQFQTVDSLEGKSIGGSISINANSDIRRTGSITIVVNNSTFNIEPGGKIWLDKYIRVWVGIYSLTSAEISWNNCGIYIIDAPNYQYDVSTSTLTISLLDLMAKLTGTRNGYLEGVPVIFKAGEDLRGAIISTLKLGGFDKYIVNLEDGNTKIPIDLEFNQGVTVYDLLKALKDVYPGYEMYFDVDGTFVFQRIPSGLTDAVLIDDNLWKSLVITESMDVDFQNVKNSIEVYGKTHDPARYSVETIIKGNNIHLSITDVYQYFNVIYGFTLVDNPGYHNMTLEINSLGKLPILLEDGSPAIIPAEAGEVYYCVKYEGDHFIWLGHLQAFGMAEDTNEMSPFYINGSVGKIRLPLFGGDYDNIYSDNLAQQRAEYELYLHTNMNNTINLNCIPVYWIDVNLLVEYTSNIDKTTNKYIIKAIDIGLAPEDTMSVNMIRFYPDFPEIINRKNK